MTILTVFRTRLRDDMTPGYAETAARMVERAKAMPGFVSFKTFAAEDGERVSIILFDSEASQRAWLEDPEHREAQRRGVSEWYAEFSLTVAEVKRSKRFSPR